MQHGEVRHSAKKRVRVCWGERRGNKVVQLKARKASTTASIFKEITSSDHHASESLGHFHFHDGNNVRISFSELPEYNIENYRKQKREKNDCNGYLVGLVDLQRVWTSAHLRVVPNARLVTSTL